MFDKERKKERAIIQYIIQQRKNGWKDGEIRAHMVHWGYSTELLNNYFYRADQELMKKQVFTFVVPLVILLFVGFAFAKTDITGAITWPWTTYDCGDDYPATARYVKDVSDCVSDVADTKQNLFCYLNATDSVASLGKAAVLPYNATTYDNVDCYQWKYGTTRTSDWHQCNASLENLVFYFTDVLEEDGLGVGGLGTELYYNSSYALCYDELNCTTSTTSCDESSGYYCVGKLKSLYGSPWYSCDSTASYSRCCKGGCEGITMECGELVELPNGSVTSFTECSSDGTSGCCSSLTDCVYDSECYSDGGEISYMSGTLGLGGSFEGTMAEYTLVCSDSHWCPEGFEYDESLFACVATQKSCYDTTDSNYCNYAFGTDDINDWESDTEGAEAGCVRPDPDGDTSVAYNESCIYSGTYGGSDFYFYQDITWY